MLTEELKSSLNSDLSKVRLRVAIEARAGVFTRSNGIISSWLRSYGDNQWSYLIGTEHANGTLLIDFLLLSGAYSIVYKIIQKKMALIVLAMPMVLESMKKTIGLIEDDLSGFDRCMIRKIENHMDSDVPDLSEIKTVSPSKEKSKSVVVLTSESVAKIFSGLLIGLLQCLDFTVKLGENDRVNLVCNTGASFGDEDMALWSHLIANFSNDASGIGEIILSPHAVSFPSKSIAVEFMLEIKRYKVILGVEGKLRQQFSDSCHLSVKANFIKESDAIESLYFDSMSFMDGYVLLQACRDCGIYDESYFEKKCKDLFINYGLAKTLIPFKGVDIDDFIRMVIKEKSIMSDEITINDLIVDEKERALKRAKKRAEKADKKKRKNAQKKQGSVERESIAGPTSGEEGNRVLSVI